MRLSCPPNLSTIPTKDARMDASRTALVTRLKPLVSRMRSKFGLPNDHGHGAARRWEVAPATRSVRPPALYDPADLDRITGVGSTIRDVSSERRRVLGGPVENAATVAYELRDAVISRGQVFTWRTYLQVSDEPAPVVARSTALHLDHASMASSWIGCRYFGHWLMDDLPRQLAAQVLAPPLSVLTRPTPSQRDYATRLDLALPISDEARVGRLIVIDDFGQNADKQARYEQLRARARTAFPVAGGQRVMLLRGATGKRRMLVNEASLATALAARGFVILDPGTCSVEQILATCVDAALVVGVEGSQILNGAMWARTGGTVLTIQPPHRFELIIKDLCDAIGLQYAFVVGERHGETDFMVDVDQVLRMIDRIEAGRQSYPAPSSGRPITLDARASSLNPAGQTPPLATTPTAR